MFFARIPADPQYCPQLLPTTAVEGSAEAVAAHLLGQGSPRRWSSVGDVLRLLSPLLAFDESDLDRAAVEVRKVGEPRGKRAGRPPVRVTPRKRQRS